MTELTAPIAQALTALASILAGIGLLVSAVYLVRWWLKDTDD